MRDIRPPTHTRHRLVQAFTSPLPLPDSQLAQVRPAVSRALVSLVVVVVVAVAVGSRCTVYARVG